MKSAKVPARSIWLAVILTLPIGVHGHAAETGSLPQEMKVRVYGAPKLDNQTLEDAERVASSIFASAGLKASYPRSGSRWSYNLSSPTFRNS